MADAYPTNGFFRGSSFGAPTANSTVYQSNTGILGGESQLSRQAKQQHASGLVQKPEEEEKKSNNSRRNQNQQQPTTTTLPQSPAPTGSSLVAGGPGTGTAASYATSYGLNGAVSSGGLGTYAGSTGLMSGTAAGTGAGWSGLGAASSGMAYGGSAAAGAGAAGAGAAGAGAASTGAAAASGASWGSLGAASAGMTYGSGAAAGAGAAGAGGAANGAAGAIFSNPITAIIAAIIGTANYLHNKDISPWSETLKGKGGGNMLDYYGGRNDGKEHGFLGKVFSKDGSTGQTSKAITDFNELDFKNAFKHGASSIKSLFKGKIWG